MALKYSNSLLSQIQSISVQAPIQSINLTLDFMLSLSFFVVLLNLDILPNLGDYCSYFHMSKRDPAIFILLVALLATAHCGLRFHDEQMMKEHHHETNPSNAALTVHLIPHSHDDVGWLKTVDNYFYGGDMRTQFAGVQYTIDTVVSELSEHPEYKFSIVEMAFLYRWWNQATDRQRQQMKTLVANGQIEFINAGWCMSDEANMYYEDFIDQMTVGLRWLKDTLNYVPQVAWHIDPFGHHSSSATLFSQMGFQAFFFARIDYQDKQKRLNDKAMEMVWRPLQYTGDKSTYMFTHVNYYHYSPPPGFCFDDVCRDEPIKDDPTLEDYNIDVRSNQFVQYFKSMGNHYRTNNLLHTLGEDFQYTNSRMWYKNVDKLIKYINTRPEFGVTVQYSTPSAYIEAIRKEGATYPTKTDDFFPYADNPHAFWTGYFVSRVALKGFVKDFSRYTQAARKHISELKISGASSVVKANAKLIEETIFGMQMALGILQHHDAVAGTAKQKVTDDYIATSLRAIEKFNDLYKQIKAEEIEAEIGEAVAAKDLYINLVWNETGVQTGLSTQLKAGKTVLISLYNPSSKGSYIIRLKVGSQEVNIVRLDNAPIAGDVVCANPKDGSDCELVFSLDLPESGNSYVKLVPVGSGGSAKVSVAKELTITEQIKQFALGNDKLRITKGNQNFDLTLRGVNETFTIGYNYYEGWTGGQNSGAYIFRPKKDTPLEYSPIKKIYYVDGATTAVVVLEGDRTLTRVSFSKAVDYVRNFGFMIETFVDSIPISDGIGKEVTLNLKTKYNNGKTFYTDSMGLEEQTRILDYRPTWAYQVNEPTSGNYYPINSHIKIQDSTTNKTITVVTDRSQGGTVMRPGEIEIMIHRRLLADDGRGVDEPLNETDADKQGLRQLVRHYVVFGNEYRAVQKWNDQRILPTFAPSTSTTFSSKAIRSAPITVPETVKLYLRPFEDGSYLLRLHNMNPVSSTSVSLDSAWKITEHTLAANQLKSDWKKKQYTWNEEKTTKPKKDEAATIREVTNMWADIEGMTTKAVKRVNNLVRMDKATTIPLLPFEMKAFKISN